MLVLDGTGHGHGVGMSQWGAEYLARAGLSADAILSKFYPGTGVAEAAGLVRVAVHKPTVSTTTLTFPSGGEVRSAAQGSREAGFPVRVGRGGKVRIAYDGVYRVTALVTGQSTAGATRFENEPCALVVVCTPTTTPTSTTSTTAPTTTSTRPSSAGGATTSTTVQSRGTTTATSNRPVSAVPESGGLTSVDDRGRSYRGIIEANAAGGLRLINILGVEDYLRGMAEVPGTWPPAAVQAQSVAARTYALRAMHGSGELCDDERCQVYVGATAESPGQNAAVAATAKRVLMYEGQLAAAVYSADAGGVSANTLEGFGTPDGVYPYLRTVSYNTDNPLPWHLVVGLQDLARRFGYRGTISGARVDRWGPSRRALQVVLEGTAGDRAIDGRTFASGLGLRSTRFTARLGTADGAPLPPPPAEEAIQALPDATAALARQPVRPVSELRLGRMDSAGARTPRLESAAGLDPRRRSVAILGVFLAAAIAGALTLNRGARGRCSAPAPAAGCPSDRGSRRNATR